MKDQLKIGGRLVIPVGRDQRSRSSSASRGFPSANSGARTWPTFDLCLSLGMKMGRPRSRPKTRAAAASTKGAPEKSPAQLIADVCEPISSIDSAQLGPLLARIGDARLCYWARPLTALPNFIACGPHHARTDRQERFPVGRHRGDWPDAARVDHYVRHLEYSPSEWTAFARFPTWMWRNNEVRAFVDWLREHNALLKPAQRVAFHGLDLYSLYDSIRAVLKYLDDVDPSTAQIARARYGCLTPWQSDPATYGHAH